jgi:tetratricopeptide (TPR) repeat protein
MKVPSDIRDAYLEARRLHAAGQLLEAERIYRSIATEGPHRADVLEALADLFLQQQRLDESLSTLRNLVEEQPENPHFAVKLATVLDNTGQTAAAIAEYESLIERQPEFAIAHFNLALLYKKQKRPGDALAAYETALRLDIDHPEEAYSNMGILYSEMQEEDKAREMYQRAIQVAPAYEPALYNLAGHYEEVDDKQKAVELYQHILAVNPRHWDSMARLVYPQKISGDHQGLVDQLEAAVAEGQQELMTRERLHFALGKAYDDLKEYDKAARNYTTANELGKVRAAAYNQERTATLFQGLIDMFDADWVESRQLESTAEPIFVCGMFRSGSTLLERMLGAHPAVAAGGELDFLPWLVGKELAPFPVGVKEASPEKLQHVADEYLRRVAEQFPGEARVTDKRPDNFLHLGLLKVLYPGVKIIHARRFILDNSLSLYFQQLGNNFSYATDLQNCAHYIQQQQKLVDHWSSLFGENIFPVNYEDLVATPEDTMRGLLEFLGLPWDPVVLDFHKGGRAVKTPSLWQVREDIHTRSRGRWQNYTSLLGDLVELAAQD